MKKYSALLRHELHGIFRDPMSVFALMTPVIFLAVCGWLLPTVLTRAGVAASGRAIALLIGLTAFLTMGGFLAGVLLGFSLLDNRDESVLQSIGVTPMGLRGYILFKTVYITLLSLTLNFVSLLILKYWAGPAFVIDYGGVSVPLLDRLAVWQLAVCAIVGAASIPFFGSLIVLGAKNKIEGFAFIKVGGLVIMLPLLCLLSAFKNGWQYALAWLPNFWSTKAMLNTALASQGTVDLPFWGYMTIGLVYSAMMSVLMFQVFIKKFKKG